MKRIRLSRQGKPCLLVSSWNMFFSRLRKSLESKQYAHVGDAEPVEDSPEKDASILSEPKRRRIPFAPTDEMLWEREREQKARGIGWMTRKEMTQAVPPVYTQFIGEHLVGEVTK